MKTMLPLSFALFAGAAQAHESLVPHHHPHGISALPGLEFDRRRRLAAGARADRLFPLRARVTP